MTGWIWRVLVGRFTSCRHKWSRLEEIPVRRDGGTAAWVYVLQCEKCGDIGKRKVNP